MKTAMVWSTVLICGALLVASPGAHAQQFGLSAQSYAYAYGYDRIPDGTGYYYYGWGSITKHDAHTGQTGPVLSNASCGLGLLYVSGGGRSSASADYNHLQSSTTGYSNGGSGTAETVVRSFDTLTVSSDTLALNTPVSLLMTVHYTGTLRFERGGSLAGSGIGSAQLTIASDTSIGDSHLAYNDSMAVDSHTYNDIYVTRPIDKSLQQTILTYVGAILPLNAKIDIYGTGDSAASSHGYSVAGADMDSFFGITSQTSGVTLLRASAAVPEPGTLALLLGIVPGATLFVRRRK